MDEEKDLEEWKGRRVGTQLVSDHSSLGQQQRMMSDRYQSSWEKKKEKKKKSKE